MGKVYFVIREHFHLVRTNILCKKQNREALKVDLVVSRDTHPLTGSKNFVGAIFLFEKHPALLRICVENSR